MTVLVTAFDPFGGMDTNSSLMVLESLGNKVGNIHIEKLVVPTVFNDCVSLAWDKAMEIGADAIVCMGQAGGRGCITLEVIGINYAFANICDNRGIKIEGEKLSDDGENAIFSTLPVKDMVNAVKNAGFDASLSVSAGGFVCNSLLYGLLKKAQDAKCDIKIGFVHLPYEKTQGKDGFAMNAEDMLLCVEKMIEVI